MKRNTEQRKLAAIMFTDMVGYSALSQRNEALALELLEEHRGVLRRLFPKYQGTEVKTTGDGFLVEFASALDAVRCAVEIQKTLAERNQTQPAERQVRIRIGVHLGDMVRKEGDVYGDGVNIAARIEPLAEPGGICISNSVHDQIENKVDYALVRLSKPELKNIQANVQVYKLVLDAVRPPAPSHPGRRRQAIALGVLAVLAAGLFVFLKFGARPKSSAAASNAPNAVAEQKSIAVLPFVNMSADKDDEYLSDGMTEELLNVLAKVKGLRVPGRSASFAFKGKNEEDIFRKVGDQLHVNTVLEGSVRKAGDKLRITAQLINVADGLSSLVRNLRWRHERYPRHAKRRGATRGPSAGSAAGCGRGARAGEEADRESGSLPALPAGPLSFRQVHASRLDQCDPLFRAGAASGSQLCVSLLRTG